MSASCDSQHYSLCRHVRLAAACVVAGLCVMFLGAYASVRELTAVNGLTANELDEKVWRFAGREMLDRQGGRIVAGDNFHIEGMADRCDFYVYRNDSVLWTGYNIGRSLGMLMDAPVPVSQSENLQAGASLSFYQASGQLNVSTHIRETGRCDWRMLGCGDVITMSGDTIHKVTLMRQVSRALIHAVDYADNDSVERVVHRWYAPGSQVPVAVQTEGVLYACYDDAIADVEQDNGEKAEKEEIIKLIDNARIIQGNGVITVALDAATDVYAFIMDAAGNLYGTVSGHRTEFVLDASSLPHNTYVVSLVALGADNYTRKVLVTK